MQRNKNTAAVLKSDVMRKGRSIRRAGAVLTLGIVGGLMALPLLASDIPGNRWPVLGDSGDPAMGVLFDPRDPGDFVKKALLLIDNAKFRQKLGEAGTAYACRMPGPCDEARALVGIYEAAMKGKG